MEFIESKVFTRRIKKLMTDNEYRLIQENISRDLRSGAEIKKKTWKRRFPSQGHGKRGGCRIVYWHSLDERFVHMLFVFSKNEQDTLTPEQDGFLVKIVGQLEEVYDG